jgi:hypothetical protein
MRDSVPQLADAVHPYLNLRGLKRSSGNAFTRWLFQRAEYLGPNRLVQKPKDNLCDNPASAEIARV